MSEQATDRPVRLIFRFPFKRPADFHAPQIEAANEWTVEERVWRVESVGDGLAGDEPGSPAVELSIATPRGGGSSRQQSGDEDGPPEKPEVPARVGSGAQIQARRSVEPRLTRRLRDSSRRGRAVEESEVNMRQSMLADAIGSQFLPDRASRGPAGGGDRPPTAPASTAAASAPAERKLSSLSSSSSFSDLSSSSLTESAMQDALISEAMAASTTMSSLLGSRMFPWSKKR
ncbi:hypothetical protein GGF46_001673 [Coemansia sp. RSA 552]|nr:hypothetical protein GGF46_001673 [Coemansia sp. RSA 552]